MVIRFLKRISNGFLAKLGRNGRSRDDTCDHAQAGRESPEEHPFSADRPITVKSEDRLNRVKFAEAVADAIGQWHGRDSLVVGLFGEWGVGKTSIINMARERLDEKNPQPIVVDFNPWEWTGHEELATALFREIELVLSREADPSLSGKLREYMSILEGRVSLADNFLRRVEIAVSAVGLAAAGISSLFLSDTAARTAVVFGGSFVAVLAQIRAFTSRLAERFIHGRAKHRSLNEAKQDLRDALSESDSQLLIVVDDIDRLTPSDTVRMSQIIKANADLPKLVFLLAFDQHVVAQSVAETLHVDGHDYVEKIVQVGFDVPSPDQFDLATLLEDGINRATTPPPIANCLDDVRLQFLYYQGLTALISTPRQVTRFSSMLEFQLARYIDGAAFDIDPVDFIALEVIRQREPVIYSQLAQMKATLTRARLTDDAERQVMARQLRAVLDLQQDSTIQSAVGNIIRFLFPLAKAALDDFSLVVDQDQLLRDKRVAHRHLFDRYFQFTIPTRDLSEREIAEALALSVKDRHGLANVLRGFIERNVMELFLDRVRADPSRVPADGTVGFITALFDVGDALSTRVERMFLAGGMPMAMRALGQLLDLRNETDRASLMKAAIGATGGIAIPVEFLRDQAPRANKAKQSLLDADTIEEVQRTLANRIRQLSKEGRLQDHRHLVSLLWGWDEWAPGEASDWAADQSQTKDGLLRLIGAFRGIGSSEFDHPLGRFLNLESGRERATNWLADSATTDEERELLGQLIHPDLP